MRYRSDAWSHETCSGQRDASETMPWVNRALIAKVTWLAPDKADEGGLAAGSVETLAHAGVRPGARPT
jgi:hypothetical protein